MIELVSVKAEMVTYEEDKRPKPDATQKPKSPPHSKPPHVPRPRV